MPAAEPFPDYVQLGLISGLFGTRGWLKTHSFTRPRANLLNYSAWWLALDGQLRQFQVAARQIHGNSYLALLDGITERDGAAQLVKCAIYVPLVDLPLLPVDEYYWGELLGMQVLTQEQVVLGSVHALVEAGDHDVLVIRGTREYLIPFVRNHYVVDVQRESKRIVVDWHVDD